MNTRKYQSECMLMLSSIFAGDMWPIWNFGDPNKRYQSFLSTAKPSFQNFIDNIILYDEIVVPTDDFLSLAALVGVLGVQPVINLFDAGVVRMVRTREALGYTGNGGGLISFGINGSDQIPRIAFADPAQTIEWALDGLNSVRKIEIIHLTERVLNGLQETSFEKEFQSFRKETYSDVMGSKYLRDKFELNGNLSNLTAIESAGVRIYGGVVDAQNPDDQISSLLKIAHTNLEMRLANLSGCSDISTRNPIGHVLMGKQERRRHSIQCGAFEIKELAGVPDLGTQILQRPQDLNKLLELRSSKSGIAFRKWFHEIGADIEGNFTKAYVELLQEKHVLQSSFARTMRLIITGGWALVEPVSGTTATVVDNFILNRFLDKKSPKFFLNNLKQFPTK